ncbi:hypothetical protein Tco_0110095 [Tanacetum coccineum]
MREELLSETKKDWLHKVIPKKKALIMIGSLMYLTTFRLNMMFAVCACARFQVTPKTSHPHVVKRIFRYLKSQPRLGLCNYGVVGKYLQRHAFWSLNEDILEITVLTTNTPYSSRKIRLICACTHQRPRRKHDQYAVSREDQYAVLKIWKVNILEDIKRGPYSKKLSIRRIEPIRYAVSHRLQTL